MKNIDSNWSNYSHHYSISVLNARLARLDMESSRTLGLIELNARLMVRGYMGLSTEREKLYLGPDCIARREMLADLDRRILSP